MIPIVLRYNKNDFFLLLAFGITIWQILKFKLKEKNFISQIKKKKIQKAMRKCWW